MKKIALLMPLVCLVARAQIPPSIGTLVSTTIILDESQYVGKPCTLYAHNYQNPLTGHLLYCSAIGLNFNISVIGTWAILNMGGGGSVAWGSILGTLSNQTDLQTALNAKQATGNYITALTGDATASGPGSAALTLTTVNSNVGACGDATHTSQITLDAKGRATGCTPVSITATSGITALTGDVTATGPGSAAATLAAVGSAGSCGDSTHSCQLTFDTKGRETARATVAISGGGGAASSITSGVLGSLPATCAAGDVYFATNQPAGQQLYQCTATNTWLQTFLNDSTITLTAGAFGVDLNQFCRFTNSCTVPARWDFSGAASTSPNKKGLASAIPATCTVGDTYFETDATAGSNSYGCTATNTWTLQGGAGAAKTWVKATNSVGIAYTSGAGPTDILWNTNNASNTGSAITHSTSSNTERFVAANAGIYSGGCQFWSSTPIIGNTFTLEILQNVGGSDVSVARGSLNYSTEQSLALPFSTHMAVGDYLHCQVFQNSGSPATSIVPTTSFWVGN